MRTVILVLLIGSALLVAPIFLSVVVAVVAMIVWKLGKARRAIHLAFGAAVVTLTYWVCTLIAIMLAHYDAYVLGIVVGGVVALMSSMAWMLFRMLFSKTS